MNSVIKEAIEIAKKGARPEIGRVVAHESDPYTYGFARYEGDLAICELNGKEKSFPASEIFDVNKVRDIAAEINTFGNYRPEGRICVNL